MKTIAIGILIVLLSVALVLGVWFLSSKIPMPLNLNSQMDISIVKGQPPLNADSLAMNISTKVLQSAAFVIQFAAWIFSILATIVGIFTFVGLNQLFNMKKTERKMRDAFNRLSKEHENFKESRKIEYEFTRARLFYTQGFYDEAWEILACLSDSHSFEVSMYRGMTLLKRGDISDAITAFESALEFPDADKHRVYFNLGQCWRALKQYDVAIEFYDKTIELKSNFSDAYIAKAWALRRLGKVNVSIDILKIVLALDKKNPKAYYNLACYYAMVGKPKEALDSLDEAIQIDPDKYKKLAFEDSDFESVRSSTRFKDLIKEVK